jgi:hypothetical protein
MKTLLLFCFIIFGFLGIAAQERYVKPFDEASKDQSFLAFRNKLALAIRNKDSKYVLSILDPKIKPGFDERENVEDFKKVWKINDPKSKFWNELREVVGGGGRFSTENGVKIFSAPYVYTDFPDDLDGFEYHVIYGENVNLRQKPDEKSAVVARLSGNIIKVDEQNSITEGKENGEYLWYKIETLGGKKGFVQARNVRSPIDMRAGFQKKNGKWKMIFFVGGD